jgi:hypothetical protein
MVFIKTWMLMVERPPEPRSSTPPLYRQQLSTEASQIVDLDAVSGFAAEVRVDPERD